MKEQELIPQMGKIWWGIHKLTIRRHYGESGDRPNLYNKELIFYAET